MRRALVCLNFCGCEAVWHKLKNTLKTPKMHFLPVFELMSDSLTATKVKTNQCPSHQSILLTQGPIHEIFMKNIENWPKMKRDTRQKSSPFWGIYLHFRPFIVRYGVNEKRKVKFYRNFPHHSISLLSLDATLSWIWWQLFHSAVCSL